MRRLKELNETDKFRPANPKQISLNNREMDRQKVYLVTRIYAQSPFYRVCVEQEKPDNGFYTLGPNTPVLFPRDENPREDDVVKFLIPKSQKIVIGFKLLWDGKTSLARLLNPTEQTIVKVLFALGQEYFPLDEFNYAIMMSSFRKAGVHLKGYRMFTRLRLKLVNKGMLKEVLDERPLSPEAREANLGAQIR